ncbi:tRNA (uracil54-C5-)-methyltransferase [Hydrogenimonas sp.]|nr:tRNA (uracil54-C5-)-methyltransferase [Hydrogenimonas sp.]
MICTHFGECGSCSLYNLPYNEQLSTKKERLEELLKPFYGAEIELFCSKEEHFRARAEYKIYRDESGCSYAMRHMDKKGFVKLKECPMVVESIEERMWRLLGYVNGDEELKNRLFGMEFLSSAAGDTLITMLYHRKLEDAWMERAKELETELEAAVIGRSRKQKVVLSREFVTEKLYVDGKEYLYRHYEQSFTQPNPGVNEKMIAWALKGASEYGKGDFCELYAGAGNFTIPISAHFRKCIATEISKRSIQAAKENCSLNGVTNIEFVRMSSEEFTEALEGKREFSRLKGVDLKSYDLKTVLVDPPRAGLDEDTRRLTAGFETVIYISCNPDTLARDLTELCKTHRVEKAALFDQFPYTPHMEAGVVLTKV